MKGDEFWDYDQQVDMEAFTAGRFYNILAKQSHDVTSAIARQKDQVTGLDSIYSSSTDYSNYP